MLSRGFVMTGRHLTTVRCSQVIGPVFIVQAPLVKHCHLSSLHATCHSDLAVVIIPCNREHVAWHHLALQPVMMRNWGWVESFENSQSSVSVVWPPAVLLIILSLTKWRHINFYSDLGFRSIMRQAREPLGRWLVQVLVILFSAPTFW